jgi:hypothetical protein
VTRHAVRRRVHRPALLPAFAAVAVLFMGRPALACAQEDTVADGYADRFSQAMGMSAVADGVADVRNLVLTRDVARFTLASGKLYLLSPIGGRTVAALFHGTGSFAFAPTSPIEQQRLARSEKSTAIDAPVTDVLFLFADSSAAELRARLAFHAEGAPALVRDRVRDGLKYVSDEDSRTFDPDLMSALLNGEHTDLFYAYVARSAGSPLMFMIDPHQVEQVTLSGKAARHWGDDAEVLTQFPLGGRFRDPSITGERVDAAQIRSYTIAIDLPQSGIGDIGFAATAKMAITAEAPVGPWVAFELFPALKVDSASWEGGEPATVFKGKDSNLLWIRMGAPLKPGETRTLTLSYHGDLIERFIDFFRIRSSAAWYPLSLEGRTLATFDLTFHTADAYLLASVGDRTDSSRVGRTVTTRWVTPGPIRNASFNLGLFKDYTLVEPGIPPVTVMISEESHKKLSRVVTQQRKMRQTVGADVGKSLQFFQSVYGPLAVNRVYATEIPEFHGEAFPGMLQLSWVTFSQTSDGGEDAVFRAHEVAHQWWGIGVDYQTYHDQWLSEGFAEFSGLWFMQTSLHSNDKYFNLLRRYRSSIIERREVPGPISLGYRVQLSRDADLDDYSTVVYKKGAWVVHMLRILMLDLRTMNEDHFTGTMQDFYRTYQGKRASTDDFRRVVEAHVGTNMGWFFDQWVYGTAIPTYAVASHIEPADGGQFRVRLRVEQHGVPDSFLMYVPVTVDMGKDRVARVRVKITGPKTELELPLMPAEPKAVRFNDFEGVLADVKEVRWGS